MALKTNLFVKIFIGFWLVTSIILGSWFVAARYFDSLPGNPVKSGRVQPPRQFMLKLFYDLENVTDRALPELLKTTKAQHNIDIFLLTPKGRDLYDRELLPGVARLANQLNARRRRASAETPHGFMLGHSIYRDSTGPLRAVVIYRPKKSRMLNLLGRSPGFRLTLAILVSGLVCFALSRALTNRLKRIQVAATQLAEGDLGTRISVREQGGDESDELARNFNSMAGQLQDKIQAQKRLLSDVSHELRSPLARLRIALALAQDDPENKGQHMQRIDLETERLEALIGELLSSQNREFSAEVYIDLVPLLLELCADASFEGEPLGKQVRFFTELKQAVLASHGDLLKRCFENILRNALHYTADNTVVDATLCQTDNCYVISISDHGPGIAEAELENIFGEFYRVDNARQRKTGGYGLGLSIAKRAIEQHRGSVRAINTDKGLEIIVTFPTNAAHQTPLS